MTRLRFSALLLLGVAGCAPDPPPPSDLPSTTPSSSPATTPESEASDPPSSSSSLSNPAIDSNPLRDLAARLLKPDGRGGWVLDETTATEFEKLSSIPFQQMQPLLDDPAAEVRRGAAYQLLSAFDPDDSDQVAAFLKLLSDDDPTVRGFGLSAVKQLPREQQSVALPQMIAMLDPTRESKPENRANCARMLGSLRATAMQAHEALAKAAAGDPDAKTRATALAALNQVDQPVRSLAIFTAALDDGDGSVRLVAAAKLRDIGLPAAPAAMKLAERLADADARVGETAAEALIAVGKASVEPLIGVLATQNVEAKKLALACLAKLGPAAKDALPAIEKCKSDDDALVRQLAEAAIQRIGQP